jgi:hypothetical protein
MPLSLLKEYALLFSANFSFKDYSGEDLVPLAHTISENS